MKTILCLSVSLIGLFASVATASAVDESAARVTTSRSLRVACVRDTSEDAPWYVLQQAFSTSLSANLPGQGNVSMPVKMVPYNATRAAVDLINGECDAAVASVKWNNAATMVERIQNFHHVGMWHVSTLQ